MPRESATSPGPLLRRRGFLAAAAAAGCGLAAAPLLAGCGGPVGAARSKTLVLRLDVDMGNLDPAFATGRSDYEIMECLYEGLRSYRPGQSDTVSTLVDEFQVSPDGLEIKFSLKRGIPFHAGYGEVTALDVKYSYERIAGITKPTINSSYQGDWSALEEVRVTGTYSGVIRLKHLFAPLYRTTLPL
ncbi:MAG: peptide transporter substrate-binding protein [Pseudonocardia sp.]|nr:peptide transporter substrate-binding protein [Pseudonocardia sp.]